VEKGTWLEEILGCLAGDREPDALVATAGEGNPEQRCEAWFYAAESCLLAGQIERAREWYQRATTTGLAFDPDAPRLAAMAEYHLAVWRLDQLTDAGSPSRDQGSEPRP
jgi:hypothetical protein